MGVGWGVLGRKLVWSLGTAKGGRLLQTLVLFHYKFAVGVLPTLIFSHRGKPKSGISMWILQSRSFYRKRVFNRASFAICHTHKTSPVVGVQHKGGSDIRSYPGI